MESTPANPAIVLDLLEAFRRSKAMFAALSLGVFDALAQSPRTASDLAAELQANAGALRQLLDACVGLGLLTQHGGHYRNTPTATIYLCRSSPQRLTGYANYSNDVLWKLWGNLEGAVREGTNRWKQTYGWDGPIFSNFFRTADSRREFLQGMHGLGLLSSPRVVRAFDLGRFRRLVDLGGATGHLAMAACERYPELMAVVFDLPEVVPVAREMTAASPVATRVSVQAGDFFTDLLPKADLFAVGRILHDWPEAKILTLLLKVFAALPVGGALLVAEKLIHDDRGGPTLAHLQSLNMLVCTEGKERTLNEYEALMRQAGFAEVMGKTTEGPVDAILAFKR
jgi:acetylserotonin N-methyltransferase